MAPPVISLDLPAEPFDQAVDLAARLGYESVAMHLNHHASAGAVLSVESSESDCVQLAKSAQVKGVQIAALILPGTTALEWLIPQPVEPGGPAHQVGRSFARLSAVLDRAAWLGARQIALPAIGLINSEETLDSSHDDAIRAALEALAIVRFEAQRRAIEIVVMVSPNGIFHSPTEARWFFDQVNSPWIGAGIEADDATIAWAAERLSALAHRVRSAIWRGTAIAGAVRSLLKTMTDARFDGTLLVRSTARPPARAEWDSHFAHVI